MTDAEPKGIAEIKAVATVLRGGRSQIESKVIISIDDSKIKVIKKEDQEDIESDQREMELLELMELENSPENRSDKDSDRSPSTGTSNYKDSD